MKESLKKCEFEVLLSCMQQTNFDIAYQSKVNSNLLIINQCDREEYQEVEVNGCLWRMISTTDRGLSKSRNLALKNARGEICLFADDDETFLEGYQDLILEAFARNGDASLMAFNVNRINVPMKKTYYHITKEKISNRGFGSPMTAIRLKNILQNNICFNEMFGSGTSWGGGEDSIFQCDIRKNHLLIYECPSIIATIDYGNESKWFHGYTEEYFYNQGAFSEYCKTPRLIRELYNIYSSFYKLRKEKQLGPIQKIKWKHKGEKGWKNGVTYSQFVANGYQYRP